LQLLNDQAGFIDMKEAVMAETSRPFGAWMAGWALVGAVADYWRDACERSILFLDVLRERGDNYRERGKQAAPHVLNFAGELIMDGRTLPRPVNYGLVRIVPPEGMRIDERKRPFIIFDPRAGHGPGIGGMKHESEIGVALQAGHSCYFVGFLPAPMPGQTVGDVCAAEARFIEAVIARHPDAEGRPVLIGNCQAGWQIMITAGVALDPARNATGSGCISADESRVASWVVRTDEERIIARHRRPAGCAVTLPRACA
jgi:hypothetical protein